MNRIIYTKNAPEPVGPYSQAVLCGETLYCSGQIPLDPETGALCGGDIAEQTVLVCENIRAVLSAAGMTFDNVAKTTCFLTDMEDFAAFNAVYTGYFTASPARSCVAVKALPKGAAVEIEVIAVV